MTNIAHRESISTIVYTSSPSASTALYEFNTSAIVTIVKKESPMPADYVDILVANPQIESGSVIRFITPAGVHHDCQMVTSVNGDTQFGTINRVGNIAFTELPDPDDYLELDEYGRPWEVEIYNDAVGDPAGTWQHTGGAWTIVDVALAVLPRFENAGTY